MNRKETPEINAGSMADIAFLLLIFFLVTTTMDVDSGILKKIPEKQENREILLKDKNVLEVSINQNNEIFVENDIIKIEDLKKIAIDFIDNGGGLDKDKNPCTWCEGKKNPKSSDHPTKALITIQSSRKTAYKTYISVLNDLLSATTFLRNRLCLNTYGISYTNLEEKYKLATKNREDLEKKILFIREKYPLLISDIENTN